MIGIVPVTLPPLIYAVLPDNISDALAVASDVFTRPCAEALLTTIVPFPS